jgi:hypothetical protein
MANVRCADWRYLDHFFPEWIGGASSGLGEFACGVPRTQIVLRWHLMGVHVIGMHLVGVHLVGVYLIGVDLIGTHLMGVHLRACIS